MMLSPCEKEMHIWVNGENPGVVFFECVGLRKFITKLKRVADEWQPIINGEKTIGIKGCFCRSCLVLRHKPHKAGVSCGKGGY